MIKHKSPVDLAYDANVKRIRTEGAIVLAEMMNEALNEMTAQFKEAQSAGSILRIGGSRDEMIGFLRIAAEKQLGMGSGSTE